MSKQKTIALIDGDTLSFRAAAAAETRAVEVFHKPSGRSKIFKTRTAFKESLKEKNFEFKPEDYEYNDIQSEEDVSHPLHSMKVTVKRIMEISQADEYRLFVGGEGNFRLDLPLPTRYKSSRTELLRPIHLDECKQFALRGHGLGGELVEGNEADDALIYVGNKYLEKGYRVVLGSQDKDSHAYTGLEIYDFTNSDLSTKDIWKVPDVGGLYINEKDYVKGNGFIWFCHQLLLGDNTDSYKPVEILGIKFGEKSSYKLLKDCKTKQEAWDVVVGQYKKWFKDNPEYTDWKGDTQVATPEFMLQLYFRCARMMSTVDDKLDLQEFMKKEGLSYDS